MQEYYSEEKFYSNTINLSGVFKSLLENNIHHNWKYENDFDGAVKNEHYIN